jgi:hypothetical protein
MLVLPDAEVRSDPRPEAGHVVRPPLEILPPSPHHTTSVIITAMQTRWFPHSASPTTHQLPFSSSHSHI